MDANEIGAQSVAVLKQLPEPDGEAIHRALRQALAALRRKIAVLDDDPTGVQTVHGVSVYTQWDEASVLEGFQEDAPLFFILTNSRAFTTEETERVHAEIAVNIATASRLTHQDFLVISRGDSTLRGHYPLETDTLRRVLGEQTGKDYRGEVILPFFSEGRRFTLDNIHYVREGEQLVPAGQTEFAKDKTFGYHSSHLGKWCEEKTAGRFRAEEMIYLSVPDLRTQRAEVLARRMLAAHGFQKIIVNAVEPVDVDAFCVALCMAVQAGGEYLFRSAAALPKVLGGIPDRPLLSPAELVAPDETHGGIVLIGSHVGKTTRQLEHLKQSGLALEYIEFNQHLALSDGGLERETLRVKTEADHHLAMGRSVVVYTRRDRLDLPDQGPQEQLKISVRISAAVTDVITQLGVRPRFIVAKGGITSSDVGTRALRVHRATVLGQVAPGVPVWKTGPESKFPGLPYVIFPGNVGEDDTLRAVVAKLLAVNA